MATGKALNGKPDAGNPHVRFDEGEVAPAATPRRGSLLYKNHIARKGTTERVLVQVLLTIPLIVGAAATYTETELRWGSTAGGDLADPTNWKTTDGVSLSADVDLNYSTSKGYWGQFRGLGNRMVPVTLSRDLYLNRIDFWSAGTTFNFDLGGHTLRFYADSDVTFTMRYNEKGQKISLENGTIDFTGAKRKQLCPGADESVVTFGSGIILSNCTEVAFRGGTGTVHAGAKLTGGLNTGPTASSLFQPVDLTVSGDDTVVDSRVNPWTLGNKANCSNGTVRIENGATVIDAARLVYGYNSCNGAAYIDDAWVSCVSGGFGVGYGVSATNNTLTVCNGSHVIVSNRVTTQEGKFAVVVGRKGGGSTLRITGAGTRLESIDNVNFKMSDRGCASVVVGHMSDGNLFHVTDGAMVDLSSMLLVGTPRASGYRASSRNNRMLFDGGAKVNASGVILGQTGTRTSSQTEGYDQTCFFSNNVCTVSGGAALKLSSAGICVAAEENVDDSAFIVTGEGTSVTSALAQVGLYGVSNRLEVTDGGFLWIMRESNSDGLELGGATAADSLVRAIGGTLVLPKGTLAFKGAAAGRNATLEVGDGACVTSKYWTVAGTGNRLVARTPFVKGKAARVYVEQGVTLDAASFSVDVSEAPGVPRSAGKIVLMEVGAGKTINISDATLAAWRTAVAGKGVRLDLSSDKRRLTMSIPRGMIVRFH